MATIDELQNALVKADAAGDAAGAKMLADHIREVSQQAPVQAQTEHTWEPMGAVGNTVYGAAKGLADLVQAPAQIALNEVNSAAQGIAPGSGVSKYIGEKTQQFNQHLADQEAQYQQETPGSLAAGIGRVGANVLPFLASGGTSAAPEVATAAPKIVQLAKLLGQGAGVSMLTQPINDVNTETDGTNNFNSEKLKQGAYGAVGSLAGAGLGKVLSSMVQPSVSADAAAALKQGITPTIGQMYGGTAANIENRLTSLPFVGDVIKNGQRATTLDFNRAAYNRVLNPIGQDASNLPLGHEGVLALKNTLGNNYDNILSKITFKGDSQAGQELAGITKQMSSGNVTQDVAAQFNSILKNNVLNKMEPDATMSGNRYKIVLSDLSNLSKKYEKSLDPNQQILGQGLRQVQDTLKNNLVRSNPEYAAQLQANHAGYANFVRIRQAASGLGTDNGIFTPSQLAAAVKAQDSSVGKGASATGQALMQDLVKVGKNVAPTFPDSGTAGRVGEMATLATLLAQPQLAVPAVVGGAAMAAPYTQAGKQLAATILARRPESAAAIAQGLKGISPALGAVLAGGSIPLLSN